MVQPPRMRTLPNSRSTAAAASGTWCYFLRLLLVLRGVRVSLEPIKKPLQPLELTWWSGLVPPPPLLEVLEGPPALTGGGAAFES